MLVLNIKNDEFLGTVEKLKEIDFAESVVLQTLFEYKIKDEQKDFIFKHDSQTRLPPSVSNALTAQTVQITCVKCLLNRDVLAEHRRVSLRPKA